MQVDIENPPARPNGRPAVGFVYAQVAGRTLYRALAPPRSRFSAPRLDAVFLSMMIPHHQGAIDMANLVPTRAAHQQLRDLATGIIQSQTAEINQMNGWLAVWFNL